jgi:hypothetical protein
MLMVLELEAYSKSKEERLGNQAGTIHEETRRKLT